MALVSASLDAFLVTSIIMISAWAYLTRRLRLSYGHPTPDSRYSRFHALLNVFVLSHSLYILYTILVKNPPNIFTRLHIPFTTSSDAIRAKLLKHAGVDSIPTAVLPKHLETLLARLSSFDARNIYVRFCSISHARKPLLGS